MLRLADQATDRVIKVDDFEPDELGAQSSVAAASRSRTSCRANRAPPK